jgi:Ca-activated chloride channel homolog
VKRTFGRVLLVLILVSLSHAADPDLVLRQRVSEVRLTVVATDAEGHPWPGLSADSLAVSDEGRAVADFQLRSADDLPLRVGILVDLSDSTHNSWPSVRAALTQSIAGLVQPRDQILMMTFNARVETERVLTRPQEIDETLPPSDGGLTALYDTIYRACKHPAFTDDLEPRRSALILFSDGDDNLSIRGLDDAIACAQRNGIAIYTVTLHKSNQWQRGDGILQKLAWATGGHDFVVRDMQGMRDALQSVHEELRSSYLLYYRPLSPGARHGFHRVEILPAQNAKLRLRARAGYYPEP